MALGFHFGGAGGGMPSNPVLFENGAYTEGIGEISCRYSSATAGTPTGSHTISDNVLQFYGNNGNGSDGVYLTIDLSNYEGKYLNFEYKIQDAAHWLSKSFAINSSSKRPVIGTGCIYSSGWNQHCAFGISNVDMPVEVMTNSNVYDVDNGSQASNPLLSIRKIWISN